jgi:hypothetical protein
VNSRSSSKATRSFFSPVWMRTGSASPASCANGAQASPSKVSGTRAGRGCTSRKPN